MRQDGEHEGCCIACCVCVLLGLLYVIFKDQHINILRSALVVVSAIILLICAVGAFIKLRDLCYYWALQCEINQLNNYGHSIT